MAARRILAEGRGRGELLDGALRSKIQALEAQLKV